MFKFDRKGIFAIFNLAVQFNLHILKKFFQFFKKPSGMKKFEENFLKENLFPLKKEEREKLFNFEKCINCGVCSSECVVLSHLEKNNFLEPRMIASSLSRALNEFSLNEVVYNCILCEKCKIVCPQDVNISEIVSFIKSKIPKDTEIFLNLKRTKNIYGEIKDEFEEFEKQSAKYVFFRGCVGKYKEKESIKNTLLLLKDLNIDFTTIKEVHCGRSVINGFSENLFKELAEENLKNIYRKNTDKIITSCPECYITFKTSPYYKDKVKVFYTVSFLNNLNFHFFNKITKKITCHDPCDLIRASYIYEEVRELINKITENFLEMKNNREFSQCCGSREGMRIENGKIVEKISESRIKEAEKIGADILLVECPSCLRNFRAVSKNLKVYSISEYIFKIYKEGGN